MLSGKLHTAVVEHLRAILDQRHHFRITDLPETGGVGVNSGIPVIDAVHVCEDLTAVGLQPCSQSYRRGVRTAAPQRGDVPLGIDALKACHDHDLSRVQLPADAGDVDILYPGVAVDAVGPDARLPAGETDGAVTHSPDGHGHQPCRHLLPGGKICVHLPGGAPAVDLSGLFDEHIRGIPLSGNHHDDLISLPGQPRDPTSRGAQARHSRKGRSSIFLHDEHIAPLPIHRMSGMGEV